jgi:uncharacterized membrane protein
MMWIGVRQDRISPRLFGILLHIGGALAFLAGTQSPRGEMPLLNSTYIGGTLISTCGLWCSHLYYKRREKLTPAEKDLHSILLIWGLIWWFGAAIAEINAQLAMQYELNATIVFVSASLWVLMKTGHKLSWSPAVYPSGFLLPVMYLFALVQYIGYHGTGPVANFGYLAWATAFSCQYLILRGNNPYWNNLFLGNWHCGTFWLGLFVLSWMIDFSLTSKVPGMEGWWRYTWGLIPVLSIHFILNFRNTLSWPLLEFDRFYRVRALYPVTVYLAVWVLAICTTPGDPQPLPYVPVLNPQDIVQLLTMHSIIVWGRQADFKKSTISATVTTRHYWIALAAIAFIWLNSIIARTIHFYYGVRYNLPAMLDSSLFQTSISIVWTLLAFIVMNTASRKTWRQAWIAGAGLLGAVVIKLFIVDLANTGTVTRIISFLSVGGMMLLIGYLSPLPPRAGKE